jgi:hypothetical protein
MLFDEVKEIIITDWSSDNSIEHLVNLDPRITIIRVNGEEFFNQTQPLNLASKFATQKNILKIDCDYILNPYYNFFDIHKLVDSDNFVAGVYKELSDDSLENSQFVDPLYGLLYVNREKFIEVGGFNEKIGKYYGLDDGEITIRLRSLGMTIQPLDLRSECVIHIPHSDRVRVQNHQGFKQDNDFVEEFYNKIKIIDQTTEETLKFKFVVQSHANENTKSFLSSNLLKSCILNDRYSKISDEDYPSYVTSNNNWKTTKIYERFYLAEKIPNK